MRIKLPKASDVESLQLGVNRKQDLQNHAAIGVGLALLLAAALYACVYIYVCADVPPVDVDDDELRGPSRSQRSLCLDDQPTNQPNWVLMIILGLRI